VTLASHQKPSDTRPAKMAIRTAIRVNHGELQPTKERWITMNWQSPNYHKRIRKSLLSCHWSPQTS